jgi:antitoxin (DNA-binding transcriptional repressor) of toxin-antitoxin stability system
MKKLNIREARLSLGNLDVLLAQEGELTITRRGEDIARVMPIGRKRPMPSHAGLRRNMPRMRKGSEQLVREDRDGR